MGGRIADFDKTICKRRNEVERTINVLKNFRAVATRFDKRAYVFHGTVTLASPRLASTRLWLWLWLPRDQPDRPKACPPRGMPSRPGAAELTVCGLPRAVPPASGVPSRVGRFRCNRWVFRVRAAAR